MDLEQTAIERLKMASDMSLRLYKQPLVITYSGGARGRPARTLCTGGWKTAFCRDKWFLKEWRIYEGNRHRAGAAVLRRGRVQRLRHA